MLYKIGIFFSFIRDPSPHKMWRASKRGSFWRIWAAQGPKPAPNRERSNAFQKMSLESAFRRIQATQRLKQTTSRKIYEHGNKHRPEMEKTKRLGRSVLEDLVRSRTKIPKDRPVARGPQG